MSNIIKLAPREKRELVCPFRTATISSQLPDGRVMQVVEYPHCQYELCPYYKYNNCSRLEG